MFSRPPSLRSRLALWYDRAQARRDHLRRAWHYAIGQFSTDEAQRLMLDCRDVAGWHPLLVLTVEDTLEQAREIFAEHPDLPRLIGDGCARVGDKRDSSAMNSPRRAAGRSKWPKATPPTKASCSDTSTPSNLLQRRTGHE